MAQGNLYLTKLRSITGRKYHSEGKSENPNDQCNFWVCFYDTGNLNKGFNSPDYEMNTIKLNHIPLSDPTNTSPLPNPTNTNPLRIQIPNTNPITNYHSNPNPIFNNTINSNHYDFSPISIINILSQYNGNTMTKIRCPLFIFNKLHELNKTHNFSKCNSSINICGQKKLPYLR